MGSSSLIIVGASARAATASAIRAGFSPWCADLFADTDLRAMVPQAIRCPNELYPAAFRDLLRQAPDVPWIYTGALENHPRLIGEMAELRPLWGNGPEALRGCRSPFQVQRILRKAGLSALEVRAADSPFPDHGRWLCKPLAGSSGQGITFAPAAAERKTTGYVQQYIEGTPMSAAFVRANAAVSLFGVTEQLIGEEWLHAPPFRYCGNIGPTEISDKLRKELLQTGAALGEQCGLRGLFGVDFILAEGRPWVVEVNPRYTASIEVIELATGVHAIAEHVRAFSEASAFDTGERWGPVVGKAILYADKRFAFPGVTLPTDPAVRIADVPEIGEVIEAGWPVVTLLHRASSVIQVCDGLMSHSNHLRRCLGFGS